MPKKSFEELRFSFAIYPLLAHCSVYQEFSRKKLREVIRGAIFMVLIKP